ncbi:PadR family transcriptional regulator [candidate division KSB1 bacterium]
MTDLTKLEETILISVLHLKENAYGVFIRRNIHELTGKELNYGTLYRLLDQLARKNLLERKEGKPIPEKGGRRKKYYTLSRKGIKALQSAQQFQKALWGESTKIALENIN